MTKPLEGVRVLDLTQAYSEPFCTMHLADQGAEVIKIEPPGGEQSRHFAPIKNDYSGYYAYMNRNKKGMVLDLKTDEGKEILRELIKEADVICENFKVGTFEKMGFSYEEMKRINPGIIYGSISGFGLEGDYAKRPCYDIIAQALSGMMSITGYPDAPPVKTGTSFADNYSGTYLAMGISMALYQREKTGEGQRLDVAMMDTLFSVLENFVVIYTAGGTIPSRIGNIDPAAAPYDSFKAKDGDFVMAIATNRMFDSLCSVMGREDLKDDPRFATNMDRVENYMPDLKDEIEKWTMTLTESEIEELLVEAGIPVARINNIEEASEHPVIKERNMMWSVYEPGMEDEFSMPGCPVKMHGKGDEIMKAAPLLGEDTDEILKSILGYTDEKIGKLHDEGII